MYKFITAVCLPRTIGPQWEEKPKLNEAIVYDIYSAYRKVYLTLTHPAIVGEVYVDFDLLKNSYASYNKSLNQLLVDLGETTLDTVDSIPVQSIKYAKYNDAIRAGYRIGLAVAGFNMPENYPDDDKHDLEISRPNTNMEISLVHKRAMVSINGFFHMTDSSGDKTFVLGGGDTMRRCNQNHAGIWSFNDIGDLKKVKIDPAKIIPAVPDTNLRDKLVFTVDEELDGKSYFLVLGGYLVFPEENVFWLSGDKTFSFDINQIPYLPRLYESNKGLDLSSMNLTKVEINKDHGYSVENAYEDKTIRSYFSLSQSYLVIIDTPYISTAKIPVANERTPGKFTSYQDPLFPLIVGHGRTAEYWKEKDDGHWNMQIAEGRWDQFVSSGRPFADQKIVTDQRFPHRPYYPSQGFLLQVAGYPQA